MAILRGDGGDESTIWTELLKAVKRAPRGFFCPTYFPHRNLKQSNALRSGK